MACAKSLIYKRLGPIVHPMIGESGVGHWILGHLHTHIHICIYAHIRESSKRWGLGFLMKRRIVIACSYCPSVSLKPYALRGYCMKQIQQMRYHMYVAAPRGDHLKGNNMTTFKQWMKDTYDKDDLQMIAKYGCDGGVSGMIYYRETCDLYDKHAEEMHNILADSADQIGSMPDYIVDNLGDFLGFKNAVVWTCANILAYEMTSEEESEE